MTGKVFRNRKHYLRRVELAEPVKREPPRVLHPRTGEALSAGQWAARYGLSQKVVARYVKAHGWARFFEHAEWLVERAARKAGLTELPD